jgi:hypothetical protein
MNSPKLYSSTSLLDILLPEYSFAEKERGRELCW